MTAQQYQFHQNFPEQRKFLESLIQLKKFDSANDVHKLMLLYALQINELALGFEKLNNLADGNGTPFQQANWILLRAIFEATVKIKYLCHSAVDSPNRCKELLLAGDKDQLQSLKNLKDACPNVPNVDEAINFFEARTRLDTTTNILKMEARCKQIFREDIAKQFILFWKDCSARAHSRPNEIEIIYKNENNSYRLYSENETNSTNYLAGMAFHFVRFACECLEPLGDNK